MHWKVEVIEGIMAKFTGIKMVEGSHDPKVCTTVQKNFILHLGHYVSMKNIKEYDGDIVSCLILFIRVVKNLKLLYVLLHTI